MKKATSAGNFPAPFPRQNRFSIQAWLSILLIFTLFTACRQPGEDKASVLKLYGNGPAGNFSKDYILFTTRCHLGQPGALMAAPGDMLWLKNWILINDPSIKSTDGAIRYIESDSVLMLNGKTAGIMLDSINQLGQLIDPGDKTAVSNLKIISIYPGGLIRNRKALEQIAGVNPGVILMISGQLKDEELKWLLGLFSPSTMSVVLKEGQEVLLAGEQQLISLHVTMEDSIYHCTPLPNLAQLRNLYFSLDGNEIAPSPENKNWLKPNPQIKSLIVTDWQEGYPEGLLSALEAPEVLIMGGMVIPETEILAHSKTLKRVITDSGELQLKLPAVQTLTIFNTEKPQAFIEQMVRQKPDCESLEIFADSKPLDLTPLQSLKKLEALTLIDADSISIEPLLQMKQLKLISYSTDSTNMDSTIAVLQAALPNTVVVANDGLCLGSGWLMALVPAMLMAMGIAVYRKKQQINKSF